MEPLPEPEVEAPPQRHARRGAVAGSDPFANLEDLTTVWIGGIPEAHPAMDELVLEDFFDRRFGHVDSLHLRVKAGTDRSWCLVSFAEEAQRSRCWTRASISVKQWAAGRRPAAG